MLTANCRVVSLNEITAEPFQPEYSALCRASYRIRFLTIDEVIANLKESFGQNIHAASR